MQLFYAPFIKGKTITLTLEESLHCIHVLRHSKGDQILLTDGKGKLYEAEITVPNGKKCVCKLVKIIKEATSSPNIHIAIAPTKNKSRFEWFLEKATEIGITEITPVITKRSERKYLRVNRLEKVIIAAMKQSLKLWKPILHQPVSYDDWINQENIGLVNNRFIAFISDNNQPLKMVYKSGNVVILIGPEGDFSQKEVILAVNNGYVPVSLGKHRLRTETAGIVACHTIQLIND